MSKTSLFSFAIFLLFSVNSKAVDLQNELTEAIQGCIKYDYSKTNGGMPNSANHGGSSLETKDQDASAVKPVIQIGCEGETARKFMEAASKYLQYTDMPYAGCPTSEPCNAITRKFGPGEKDQPGYMFCVTVQPENKSSCMMAAVFPVTYK